MELDNTMDEEEDNVWDEDWGEIEGDACRSLFSGTVLPSVAACCDYDAANHAFDFREYCKKHRLDDYQTIKCVNYIRSAVKDGQDPRPALEAGQQPYLDDQYFRPVLEDDAMLLHDFAQDLRLEEGERGVDEALSAEVARLAAENDALKEMVLALQIQALPAELQHRDGLAWISEEGVAPELDRYGPVMGVAPSSDDQPSTSAAARLHTAAAPSAPAVAPHRAAAAEKIDEQYFDSYSYFDIHREMLEDRVRTEAYRDALERNPRLVRGACVLDVGCGTGILSMFAARAGAARVVAVDGSERIADFAKRVVARNGFAAEAGGAISVVAGRVEKLKELPIEEKSADIIVSEWMGYALLFESMLDSVLHARDRWMKPGGAVLPDLAVISVAAADSHASGLDFWDNVYGFDMQDIRHDIHGSISKQALVTPVKAKHLLSPAVAVKELDLATMTRSDVDFSQPFKLCIDKAGACPAIVLWFDTHFSKRFCTEVPVVLSTSPHAPQTHWVQTVLVLGRTFDVEPGCVLEGRLSVARSEQHRSVDISLELALIDCKGVRSDTVTGCYVMAVSASK